MPRATKQQNDGEARGGTQVTYPLSDLMAMEPRAVLRASSYMPEDEDDDHDDCFERVGNVAVIRIEGALLQRGGWWWDGYERIQERFAAAIQCQSIGAVLLRINSPGGVVAGCFEAVRAMRQMKAGAGKRVIAFADEAAYSAAYAMATVADEIYLPEPGGVGSVGVIGALIDCTAMNAQMGVKVVVVKSGALKADGHPDEPLSDEVVERYQERIDDLGRQFASLVGEARRMSTDEVLAIEAACLYGAGAVEAKLADGVLSYSQALAKATAAAGEKLGAQVRGVTRSHAPATPDQRTTDGKQVLDRICRKLAAFTVRHTGIDARVGAAITRSIAADAGGGGAVSRPDGLRVRGAQLRAVFEDAREAEFVASSEAVNSYGEIDRQNWRLERFNRNPVVLFAHDIHSLPIGRAVDFRVEGKQSIIRIKYATARANPFAELCWQSVLEEMLVAGSTGFISHDVRKERVDGVLRTVCDDNELYEFSNCPVGSNPEALLRLEERVMRSLAAAFGQTNNTPGARAKDKTMSMIVKDEEFSALRTNGALNVHCDSCGTRQEVQMPQLAAEERTRSADKAAGEMRIRELEEQMAKLSESVAAATQERDAAVTELTATRRAAEQAETRRRAEAELSVLVSDGKIAQAEVEEYVQLAVESPERYQRMLVKAADRKPATGHDLTNRVKLPAEVSPQVGTVAAAAAPTDDLLIEQTARGAAVIRRGIMNSDAAFAGAMLSEQQLDAAANDHLTSLVSGAAG